MTRWQKAYGMKKHSQLKEKPNPNGFATTWVDCDFPDVIAIRKKYYTESQHKNPVNDVGVSTLYGVDSVSQLLEGTRISLAAEHSFTPDYLVNELIGFDKCFFRLMFTGKMYQKIYRLYELKAE